MRQDSWSENEDAILAATVLNFIKVGKTQLLAFEEAALKTNRTSAACGFRWNSEIRKRYRIEIADAKKIRNENKRKGKIQVHSDPTMVNVHHEQEAIETNEDGLFVTAVQYILNEYRRLQKAYTESQRDIMLLQERLDDRTSEGDLETLMRIIDRARDMGLTEQKQKTS